MSDLNRPDRIERAILEKGIYAGKTEGVSMQPMLVEGRDTVIIKKAEFPLKKYDIPVYHRGDGYVMHRVLKVTKDGYIIRGDNCIGVERDIKDKDIVGVLAAFYHDGNYVEYGDKEYMRYARQAVKRHRTRWIRQLLQWVKSKIARCIRH